MPNVSSMTRWLSSVSAPEAVGPYPQLLAPEGPGPRDAELLCVSFPLMYVCCQGLMASHLWPVLHLGLHSCYGERAHK